MECTALSVSEAAHKFKTGSASVCDYGVLRDYGLREGGIAHGLPKYKELCLWIIMHGVSDYAYNLCILCV